MGFSPDGRTVVAANHGENPPFHVKLYDVRTRLAQGSIEVDSSYPRELTFSPDGRYLALSINEGVKLIYLPRFIGGREPVKLAELPRLWEELNDADVGIAYRAQWRMVSAEADAVRFLAGKLPSVRAVASDQLARLVKDLGSTRFADRHKATQILEEYGESARAILQSELTRTLPLETRRRIESLLAKLENPRRDLSLEIIETIGTESSGAALRQIAVGMPDAQLTRNAKAALARLERRASFP